MPRVKRPASPFDEFDEDFEDDTCSNSSKSGNPPIQRNAANARERARMRVLSSAFGRLKTKLPNIPPDTKLSKLDTLRLATIYIKQLKTLAESGTEKKYSENTEVSAQNMNLNTLNFQNCASNMTWPFAFQHLHATSRQLTSQLPHNWHASETMEETLRGNNTFVGNQNMTEIADTFHNKYETSDINNCLFECLQQQQQISHYINRSHYNNQLTDSGDRQSQNTQSIR